MNRRRGFLLVFALLLTVFIALISLALLGLKKGGYASSKGVVNSVQAKSLARSGMGDIWVKLSKDPHFPGGMGDDQLTFSYREDITDPDGNAVGSYQVIMDRQYRDTHRVIRVESTGVAGALSEDSSRYTIYGEIKMVENDFGFKVWQEGVTPTL